MAPIPTATQKTLLRASSAGPSGVLPERLVWTM